MPMAFLPRSTATSKDSLYAWEGRDQQGKPDRGEIVASGISLASAILRRQGIRVIHIKKKSLQRERTVSSRDITLLTRQLATMLKAGVALLQSFEIIAKGQKNPAFVRLIHSVRADVESGSSLHQAFARYPRQFNTLFCHLVAAGEQAGLLDEILESLACYQEKTLAMKRKLRAALTYPAAIITIAIAVTSIIMIWVVPSFTEVFASVGAELPLVTRIVVAVSHFLSAYWWLLSGLITLAVISFIRVWRRSIQLQAHMDKLQLSLPVLGKLCHTAALTRWTRTLASMSAAGVPLVQALNSVQGASGNAVFASATEHVGLAINNGSSLAAAISDTGLFPELVIQMVAIGEESGALEEMLNKLTDFYEAELNESLLSLSTLVEPFIMLILGILIGGLVFAMYLPIFQLGSVI